MDWIPLCTPGYQRPEHLQAFIEALESIREKPLRVLCSVSPRHGKTDSLLRWFVWLLKIDPRLKLLYLTHTQRFAERGGDAARTIALSMGVELSQNTKSKSDWATTAGGGLSAFSVETGIIGRGWHVMVFDDPYKNSEAADSDLQRETIEELWINTARSRLDPPPVGSIAGPGGSMIVNAARWNHLDLIGKLEKDPVWSTVNLPAIDAAGAALWPERWPLSELEKLKHDMSSRSWQAQYLGQPSPESGGLFLRRWFDKRYEKLPQCDFRALFVDSAWEEGSANDFSVIGDWGMNKTLAQYYAIDQWRNRVQLPDLVTAIKDIAVKTKPDGVFIEATASGIGAIQLLKRAGIPGVSDRIFPYHVGSASKESRAERVTPLLAAGSVWFPQVASWMTDMVEECLQFPTGAHDDCVDVLSMALWTLQDPMQTKRKQPGGKLPNIYAR
jgi:predicted phage terminase large subunit-like protein